MTGKWLGHRDLCPTQWGRLCDCPCSHPDCRGVDTCQNPECPVLQMFEGGNDEPVLPSVD